MILTTLQKRGTLVLPPEPRAPTSCRYTEKVHLGTSPVLLLKVRSRRWSTAACRMVSCDELLVQNAAACHPRRFRSCWKSIQAVASRSPSHLLRKFRHPIVVANLPAIVLASALPQKLAKQEIISWFIVPHNLIENMCFWLTSAQNYGSSSSFYFLHSINNQFEQKWITINLVYSHVKGYQKKKNFHRAGHL